MMKKIAITGSTGLIGTELVQHFRTTGCEVRRIIRKDSNLYGSQTVLWNMATQTIDAQALEGFDAVIHLSGAPIALRPWSEKYKLTMLSSRVDSTEFLSSTLASLTNKPKVFLSASAIGYYGNHSPDMVVDEQAPLGNDYLAQLCRHWEMATAQARNAGIRVIHMRFGIVLSRKGGALAKMLPAFRLGLGGKLGSGKQMMSWVALPEIPQIIEFLLADEKISGPINFVSPQPVSNEDFTKALGASLHRPTSCTVPTAVIQILLGEMGNTLLLNGARVLPRRLREAHYIFMHPDIDSALVAALHS